MPNEPLTPRMRFVLCLRNDDDPASLEPRKLYEVIPDPAAEKHGLIRIVDESGEDYLFPKTYFLELEPDVSDTVGEALRRAS